MAIAGIGASGASPVSFPSFEQAAGIADNPGDTSNEFGGRIADALNNLNRTQGTADDLAMQVASGNLQDIHDFTIASTKAELATSLTVAVRNKAVDAFQQIMTMPI